MDCRAAAAFVMASRDASKARAPDFTQLWLTLRRLRRSPRRRVKTAFRSAARFVEGPRAATHAATAAASVAARYERFGRSVPPC